jgi:hypothetical protein
MAMVCPQCNGSFEQRLQCPTCNVRLLYQAPSRRRLAVGQGEDSWQQTPWGRILIGLLLAQGIYYALQNLCQAGLLAVGEGSSRSALSTLGGLIMLQALQVVGVLAAGVLVGAGRHYGFGYGALLGIWNGVLFVIAQQWTVPNVTAIALVGQPMLQAAFGGVGGLIGSWIWKPLPTLTMPAPPRESIGPRVPLSRSVSPFAGPIAWGRVVPGIAVGVGGVIWANVILQFVVEASEGKLSVDSHLQAQLVTWEICALALLTGSAFAGATTANGLKQGLAVGIGASSILLGLGIAKGTLEPNLLIFTVTCAVALGLVGGWFGGQLFPPLYSSLRRKRFRVAV